MFLLVFIVLLGRMLGFYMANIVFPKENKHARVILSSVVIYFSFIIGIIVDLNIFNINLSGLFILIGALSFGVGIGFQNIIANLISGFVIISIKNIKIGDNILIDDKSGYVKKIGLFYTKIFNNNEDIYIPNSVLTTSTVTNLRTDLIPKVSK
jgi:small-conductance mechanosensitive channel